MLWANAERRLEATKETSPGLAGGGYQQQLLQSAAELKRHPISPVVIAPTLQLHAMPSPMPTTA